MRADARASQALAEEGASGHDAAAVAHAQLRSFVVLSCCAALATLACEEKKSESSSVAPSAQPSPERAAIASALGATPSAAPSESAAALASAGPSAEVPPEAAPSAGDATVAEVSDAGVQKPSVVTDSRGVKLVDPGKEPRERIRYKFTVDRTDRMQMTTTSSMKMAMGAETASVPTAPAVKVVAALTVKEVLADGSARRTLVLEDVGLLPGPGLSKEQRDQAEKSLSSLEKLQGKDRVDTRGFVREVDLDASKIENPALRQAVASMQQTFDQMGTPFPEPEIGIGAKWQVRTKVDQMGVHLSQVADYELLSFSGDRGKIRVKLRQTAPGGSMQLPGLPKGATAELLGMKGSGVGELAFLLSRTVPDGHIDTKSEIKVRVVTPQEKQEMVTKLDARVVFKPLDAKP